MKVYIGGYRHHWNTQELERWWYRTRYDKYDWEMSKKDLDKYDRAFEKFSDICRDYICRPVNWFKNLFPRISYVKIDKYDTWSADATLAPIILPMLKQLKETKHGSPFTEDADVPEHFRSTNASPKKNEWDVDEFHFVRWDWIMSEMIWAFEQLVDDDNDDQFYKGETDILWQAIDANGNPVGEPHRLSDRPTEVEEAKENDSHLMYTLVKGPNDTRTTDIEGLKKHHERIQNGLRLFGTYFRALWD
jgi:hypothetical protein